MDDKTAIETCKATADHHEWAVQIMSSTKHQEQQQERADAIRHLISLVERYEAMMSEATEIVCDLPGRPVTRIRRTVRHPSNQAEWSAVRHGCDNTFNHPDALSAFESLKEQKNHD